MTIHHDKLAYGKLASNTEELSDKKIEEMLKQLKELDEDSKPEEKQVQNNKKNL